MARSASDAGVFLNCPFDKEYQPLFDAIVFAVMDCGFTPHSALEHSDSGQVRVEKIRDMIAAARFGIHDISRRKRFNMPFELGLFLGAKHYGGKDQRRKNCLILDRERYGFQTRFSDIAGQDISPHSDRVRDAITAVRNWLNGRTPRRILPGGAEIYRRYRRFRRDLPSICQQRLLDSHTLGFIDYTNTVNTWLEEDRNLNG